MNIQKLATAKLSPRFSVSAVLLLILSVMVYEQRELDKLDHPKPTSVDCIKCHSDKKTLQAMADKAGDQLYLVNSGQLTLAQLNHLTGKENDPSKIKQTKDKLSKN